MRGNIREAEVNTRGMGENTREAEVNPAIEVSPHDRGKYPRSRGKYPRGREYPRSRSKSLGMRTILAHSRKNSITETNGIIFNPIFCIMKLGKERG